jgi:hypothetical protein
VRNRTDETERKVRRLITEDTEIGAVRAQRLKERRKGLTQRSQRSAEGTESLVMRTWPVLTERELRTWTARGRATQEKAARSRSFVGQHGGKKHSQE